MKRHDLIAMIGIAMVVWPRASVAQSLSRLLLIGVLAPQSALNANDEALREKLRDLGYLKTAKTLGITVPQSLLLRAERRFSDQKGRQ